MISTLCPDCNETVPLLARACRNCGAPNPERQGVFAVAAVLAVLTTATAGAFYLATHPQFSALPAVTPPPARAADATAADGGFAWIRAAMTGCDQTASRQPNSLYFMVIPLLAQAADMPDWQAIAVGAIGNGLTIAGDDALRGLEIGKLRMYAGQYVFSVQDATTRAAFKWGAAVGVKQFSASEIDKVWTFRMRLQPTGKPDDVDWGDTYPRQNGACHWVATILRQ